MILCDTCISRQSNLIAWHSTNPQTSLTPSCSFLPNLALYVHSFLIFVWDEVHSDSNSSMIFLWKCKHLYLHTKQEKMRHTHRARERRGKRGRGRERQGSLRRVEKCRFQMSQERLKGVTHVHLSTPPRGTLSQSYPLYSAHTWFSGNYTLELAQWICFYCSVLFLPALTWDHISINC